MRIPATRPRSMLAQHPTECFTGEKNVKRRRRAAGSGGYGSSGATTRCRSGSSPSEYVCTVPRSRRYSCTSRRSLAVIASSATGRPVAQRVLGGVVGLAAQDHLAALAVALGVDDDPPAVPRPAPRTPAARGAAPRRSSGRGGR